jgi:hypothetical protein
MTVRPPSTPPYILMLFACTHLLFALAKFALHPSDHCGNTIFDITVRIAVPALFLSFSGTLPMQEVRCAPNIAQTTDASSPSFPDDIAIDGYLQIPSVALSCPEDDVTLWSWFTFSFVEPIFHLAKTRTLNETDVWTLSPFFRHKIIFNKCLEYRNLCDLMQFEVYLSD